jgi:hypothetical protein
MGETKPRNHTWSPSYMVTFFWKNWNGICKFQKNWKQNSWWRHCWTLPLWKTSIKNLLYSRLHKNDEFSTFQIVYCSSHLDPRICHFCWDKTTTNFWLIFCTLVDFIIIYIKNFCPSFFWKLSNFISEYLKNELHVAQEPFGHSRVSAGVWYFTGTTHT